MKDNSVELGRAFWQFEIAGVPLPHIKAWGKIGRREGEWRLKVWGERLLFCADDAPERVFALVTPCEGEQYWVAFWRAAVARGDFGELSLASRAMGSPKGYSSFLILRANSGRSWACDWCGGDWIEFIGPKLSADVSQHSLATSESDAMSKLWQRSFAETGRQDQPLYWLRGSHDEWKRVLQACATLHYGKNPEDGYGLKIEPGKCAYFFYAHTPFARGVMAGIEDYDNWEIPAAWQPLFVRNFVFVGWSWERYEGQVNNVRNAWHAESASVANEIRLSFQPSQHEQLEARLFLRDWLRGKAPSHQIEKLLD